MKLNLEKWSETQRQAILAGGHHVLVSAGAGSGKTSVLVERVIRCITDGSGTELKNLLVATFTEAAAAEMRARIVARLEGLVEEAYAAANDEDAAWLTRQLGQVEQAQISTLHSFCMNVVRRNFLTLEIDPGFSILDQDSAVVLRTQLVQELMEQELDAPSKAAFQHMINRFAGGNPETLSNLVFRIDGFSRSQPHPEQWVNQVSAYFHSPSEAGLSALPWSKAFYEWLAVQTEEALRLVNKAHQLATGQPELDKVYENLDALRLALRTAVAAISGMQNLEDISRCYEAFLSAGKQVFRPKPNPYKEAVLEYRTESKKIVKPLAEIAGRGEAALLGDILEFAPDISVLSSFVLSFQKAYALRKQRSGTLDFNDLEHMALAALEHPESREADRLKEQYAEVFVDEYQDTSPIQDAIVRAISREPGNVFVVGDVKQSIYRFRMAEPGLFLNQYNTLGEEGAGEVIDLVENYRSRKGVVDAVNYVFSQLFTESFGGIRYDDRASMKAGARYPDASDNESSLAGPVEVHLIERQAADEHPEEDTEDEAPENQTSASGAASEDDAALSESDLSAIEKEALCIGHRILELMGKAGNAPRRVVWDAKQGIHRPLEYRDIVILLRSVRGRMNRILETLQTLGIPAYGATSTGFYAAVEVQWLLSILTIIDNPRHELELVSVMRSPMFHFTDNDLARIRSAHRGHFYDAVRQLARPPKAQEAEHPTEGSIPPELTVKIQGFLSRLSDWRRLSRRASTEAVLRRILDDTGLVYYVLGMQGGDVRRANIQLLLDKARAFDAVSIDGVYGFITRARETLRQQVDSGEAKTVGERENVVRIMTIHQSKGLEFPVVFVADLGKQFFKDHQEQMFLLHRRLGYGPQFLSEDGLRRWKTLPSIALSHIEKMDVLAEEARVLYVALTRARERLILVGSATDLLKVTAKALSKYRPGEVELPLSTLANAKTYLDWLLPVIIRHRDGAALRRLAETSQDDGQHSVRTVHVDTVTDHPVRFDIRVWDSLQETMDALPIQTTLGLEEVVTTSLGAATVTSADVEQALNAHLTAPDWNAPGKVSATELRRLWVARTRTAVPPEHRFAAQAAAERLLEDPEFVTDQMTGRMSGTAFHAVMQHVPFQTLDADALQRHLAGLAHDGLISEDAKNAVSVEDVQAFLASPLGIRLGNAKRVFREQPFFSKIVSNAARTAASGKNPPFVIAQGVIDVLAEEEQGWLIVDYKTDNVDEAHVPEKAEEYKAQVAAYLDVVQSLTGGSPVEAYLYFVKPRIAVSMAGVPLSRLFERT